MAYSQQESFVLLRGNSHRALPLSPGERGGRRAEGALSQSLITMLIVFPFSDLFKRHSVFHHSRRIEKRQSQRLMHAFEFVKLLRSFGMAVEVPFLQRASRGTLLDVPADGLFLRTRRRPFRAQIEWTPCEPKCTVFSVGPGAFESSALFGCLVDCTWLGGCRCCPITYASTSPNGSRLLFSFPLCLYTCP